MPSSTVTLLHVVESFSSGTLQAVRTLCQATGGGVTNHILHGCRDEGACASPEGFSQDVSLIPWPAAGREISPGRDYRALGMLKKTVAELRPNLIHAHSSKAGALVRLAFPWGRIPLVYSPHGYAFLRRDLHPVIRGVYWSLEYLLGWIPQVTVACGIAEYGLARQVSRRVVYIPNMLDLTAIDAIIAPVRQRPRGGMRVGTVGGIRPQKNFPLFCRVAAAFEGSGVQFLWIGGGEVPPSLTLPDNLDVTGWLDHSSALTRLAACDLYLQTSRWEGLSIAVLEGMALGLPILATPAPGNVELVIDGHNGYLCATASDFTARLQGLARDPPTLARLGAASRQLIEQGFTVERTAPRWMSLYQQYPRYRRHG
ncbi:MAG: glycosyltransferase [Pseudomonadota bacterium]